MHFTKNPKLCSDMLLNIKGVNIQLQNKTKILDIMMDSELQYKSFVKKIFSKGLKAALTLK